MQLKLVKNQNNMLVMESNRSPKNVSDFDFGSSFKPTSFEPIVIPKISFKQSLNAFGKPSTGLQFLPEETVADSAIQAGTYL